MKCLDSLHASLTDNLSLQTVQTLIRLAKCWLSFKSKLFDRWYFRLASVLKNDTPEQIRVSFHFSWRYKTCPSQEKFIDQKHSQFSIPTLLLNDCNLLSLPIDTLIISNLISEMEQFV